MNRKINIPTMKEIERLLERLKLDAKVINTYGKRLIKFGVYPYMDKKYMDLLRSFQKDNEYRIRWLEYYANGGVEIPRCTMNDLEAWNYDNFFTVEEIIAEGKCSENCGDCEYCTSNYIGLDLQNVYCKKFYRNEEADFN